MKIRHIKRTIAHRLLTRRPTLRPTRVQIKVECSVTGMIDAVKRVRESVTRFASAAAEAAVVMRAFAATLDPHQHAIDDWRLHPRDQG
jgi:hypothetical protein